MNEIIDILNKQGEIIGSATKANAHKKKLLHFAAEIFIQNNEGKILSQLRKASKHHYPLHWGSSASGHVKQGETPEKGALRELQEELGITTKLTFLGKFFFKDDCENQLVFVYSAYHEGPFTIQQEELEKVEWFTVHDYEEGYGLKMTPQSRFGLQLLLATLQKNQSHYPQEL